MLVNRRVTPSIKFAGAHLYTWVKRGTVRVKCLAQEHNTMPPAMARTRAARSGDERTNQASHKIQCTRVLMTGPEGNGEFCFPRTPSSRETLRFEENKIHCSSRDQSLSDLLSSNTNEKLAKEKQIFKKRADIPATTLGHL